MADEAAPAPAPAGEAAPAPDAFEKVIAAVEARKDAAAAEGKAAGASATNSTAPSGDAAPAGKAKPKAAEIGALAQREWKVQQQERDAKALKEKYQALDGALAKKDLRAALTVMAEQHGVTFANFVDVLTEAAPPEKTGAEIAREAAEAVLRDRDAQQAAATLAAQDQEFKAKEANIRQECQARAERGAEGAPDRWELTAIAGIGSQAWDIISGHYNQTTKLQDGRIVAEGEKLSIEQALDLIEARLREKQAARRPAQGANVREAVGQRSDGRAAAPSFTNRATSGMPAAVGAQAIDEAGLPDSVAIDRIAARLGHRL